MDAKLQVLHVGPLVSVQDSGRPGHLRYGVTESGAMDRASYALANAVLNNPISNPAIEISLGGVALQCTQGTVSMAIIGGCFSVLLNDQALPPWAMFTLKQGDTLKVRPGAWGSWCYLGIEGQLCATQWLDSYSVHVKSGICGSAIQPDDVLSISQASSPVEQVINLGEPSKLNPDSTIRAVVGPQERFFTPETLAAFLSRTFTVSGDYDRMGMRLSGCTLPIAAALDMPSEPILRGSLQVPGHGDPICLMADHHTAGGYPKIATVISADLDSLAQKRTGEQIQFCAVSASDAVKLARAKASQLEQITKQLRQNRVNVTDRLWNNNLISGALMGED